MDAEISKAKMQEQLDRARGSGFARLYGWQFDLDGLIAYVTMQRKGDPNATYLLRLAFEDFPKRAPSYKFVDSRTKEATLEAWPPGTRHDAGGTGGVCTPGTREFHEIIHANDAQYPWDADRYTVLEALHMTQRIADKG
ncbi:hypothetical protein [Bradyrhizobium zhanjiangense]|uniref:Uncharacterized protein n=1 Tax=Bradyrhizobium zhanjiangense TaxID=1325107 RepID=A0ABY0DBF6_9BRAD|nr:hypothetical protein [Bradyrhizobium zhanjiangense]RXG87361.1 hypothetical protein EAS62_36080 [Bradyrhizobium zhanjiangense]